MAVYEPGNMVWYKSSTQHKVVSYIFNTKTHLYNYRLEGLRDIVLGDDLNPVYVIKWCCTPSCETLQYNSEAHWEPPSRVKTFGNRWWLFDEETGAIYDKSNSSGYAEEHELFDTEEAARAAYVKKLKGYLSSTKEEVRRLERYIKMYSPVDGK